MKFQTTLHNGSVQIACTTVLMLTSNVIQTHINVTQQP